jgi:hypothetical protein
MRIRFGLSKPESFRVLIFVRPSARGDFSFTTPPQMNIELGSALIVITRLEKIYPGFAYQINNPMLLRQAA